MNKSRFSLDIGNVSDIEIKKDEIDKKALRAFAKGALGHETDIDKSESWRNEDPCALPDYNFRLRLNKYQIGLLKHAAKIEKRSISNMIRAILTNELEKYLEGK